MSESLEGTTTQVPVSELRLYDRNPRKGNVGAIAASLKANGQYRPVTANIGTHTGKPNVVLKGNHTVKAIRQLAKKDPENWGTVAVFWVDVDADQAAKIVLADNKTSEGGEYDSAILGGLLDGIADDLDGTGFTLEDLDGLSSDEWATDVDPEAPDAGEDERDQQTSGRGQLVIAYSLIFDTLEQKGQWTDFLNWLKRRYPDQTQAERLDLYLNDLAEDLDADGED